MEVRIRGTRLSFNVLSIMEHSQGDDLIPFGLFFRAGDI